MLLTIALVSAGVLAASLLVVCLLALCSRANHFERDEDMTQEQVAEQFKAAFGSIQHRVHTTARAKGWWDKPREDGTLLALVHTEVSEALEALRHGNPPDDKIPEFSGAEAELADVIVRIMDMAQARGYDVAGALIAKIDFNEGRPIMHGGKVF